MGRSSGYCFKIIACGGSSESVDRDDLDASSENNGSDKKGWSFRKRSARHRVLSNTVVTEIPSSENKKSSEPAIINSETPVNSSISEKTSGNQWTEEMPQLSTSTTKGTTVSNMVTKAAGEDDTKFDFNPDEPSIIVIQAAVRKFLAQRELLRHKKVVKLQAAVRGHLIRCHAAGTLRCIQAIVKMQALVRARHSNLSVERSSVGKKRTQDSGTMPHHTYISIEKLLSNRFASKLLESTPRTKQINIKCDPLKSDTAWHWLERWMSVSSPEAVESHAPKYEQDKGDDTENQVGNVIQPHCELTNVKSDVGQAAVPSEAMENLINSEQKSCTISHDEKPQPANTIVPESKQRSDFLPDETRRLNSGAQVELNSFLEKPVVEAEQTKRPGKRVATEQADSEGRKSVFGSRKASNPSFIAAQSRFEERTFKSNSLRSVGSSNQDNVVVSPADNCSAAPENATRTRDVEPTESLVCQSSRVVQTGGSECGTELSITSTLDSPDLSEVGNFEFDKESKVLDKEAGHIKRISVEEHALLGTELTHSILGLSEKNDGGSAAGSEQLKPADNTDISRVKQSLEENACNADIELEPETGRQVYKPNVDIELETEIGHQAHKLSPEASPRSHITVTESQGTPSSQISINNKTRTDRKVSSKKHKSSSNSKKSPVSSNPSSGLRSSLEQLPRDPKPAKRRNSFGSQSSDHIDQEPRDSSSSNSIPSYMQATESARAKALVNSSPRSSPDMQGKETYMKKRHSLPGAVNGRHGSPCIKRSMTQAKQTTKGSDDREKKWQR